jgi:ABC-type Fe3+/spermidine/putrescine transport system ATPase subunit
MSSVRVQSLTKRFGSHAAVFEVSFDVPSGGAVALLGPRGCGKTTILRCLAGLETPDSGLISIDGAPVFDAMRGLEVAPERRGLGVVFQSDAVWPHMTVLENVAFPLKVRGVKLPERRDRASKMLERVGLRGSDDRSASLVSDGQRHRIALARALVHEPKLVLFDEPLSNLDPLPRQQMRLELRLLRKQLGFTAIYVTRDQAEAFGLADTIVLMNNGAIEAAGPSRDIFERPPSGFAARFFGMNAIEGLLVGTVRGSRYLEVELSERLVVRGLAAPAQELQEGGRVLACIRKDRVRLARPSRPGEANATVVAASFLGAEEEYIVDVAGVRIQSIGPVQGFVEGERVNVAMTPDEWLFLR